ncbi:RNA recognition motif domain protein [Kalmanozyma brasiliensis GHG001]|uniref:RNA recognition motif domain protein n=1 Tax=Kalmanozyma brasiliensis (strain GHG001) TaxID=1365824 RepID=UPI002867F099|nr:RNA recognition motif domain protein [Kalmanozyma brasiliensis GHG001]KAF6767577.1 RNA recognition motif domain protein [Kalmanozyma brasiliensis GHG001]
MSSRSASPQQRFSSRSPMPDSRKNPKTALRIDFLTHNVRESHLHHVFGWYGRVERVHLTPSRGMARDRDGWAHVVMGSVEEAAKAALYMNGGQIDGASFSIKTCKPPEVPREEEREEQRSWGRDRRPQSSRNGRNDAYEDRRRASRSEDPHYVGRDGVRPRGVHPDRQRMIGGDRFNYGDGRDDDYKIPMRKWGQAEPSRSHSSRSRDRSMSPPPDRSARRDSPSY